MANTSYQLDTTAQQAIERYRDAVSQRQHHRHHHDGLQDEPQPRQPQLDAVPPTEDPVHRAHPIPRG